ncbi:hypothetical protein F0562_017185 [Nyssa sinensis]|uniref:ENT domain-containing protein n=1 Tax=Nyssa sinensis TaxID=561372 RepID=A0A5J4ZIB9_9ASTE|nr:hypothetical protein F0562_017185 [Nyssa sinensis]
MLNCSHRGSATFFRRTGGPIVLWTVISPTAAVPMMTFCHHIITEFQEGAVLAKAYRSVLLAFKAQLDALTWEKESLITELRDKLRVSDGEHRELLTGVNADDVICQIRKRRQVASRKKQRTSQSAPLSFGMAPQALQPRSIAASIQLSSSAVKRGPTLGAKHDQPFPGLSSMKSTPYPSTAPTVRDQFTNCSSSGAVATKEPAEAATHDPLIGRNMAKRRLEVDKLCEAIDKVYDLINAAHYMLSGIFGGKGYRGKVNEDGELDDVQKD